MSVSTSTEGWLRPVLRDLGSIAAEGFRAAKAQRGLSLVLAAIAAAVGLLTLATTGQSVSAERAVLSRIDAGGTRTIVVVDRDGQAGIDTSAVDRINQLNAVEWAVGLGRTVDSWISNVPYGSPAPTRVVYGQAPELTITAGTVTTGALISSTSRGKLGLDAGTGTLTTSSGATADVVGTFAASGALAELEQGVVVRDPDFTGPLASIILQVKNPADVENVAYAVTLLVAATSPQSVAVDVSDDLARARAAVQGEVGDYGRSVVLQALAAGVLLSAATVFAGVSARRRDFGRRRALGATRGQLVGLVLVQLAAPTVVGAAVGSLAGATLVRLLTDTWPGWRFPLAVGVLTVCGAVLAGTLPAVVAAFRDPVAVLRVP